MKDPESTEDSVLKPHEASQDASPSNASEAPDETAAAVDAAAKTQDADTKPSGASVSRTLSWMVSLILVGVLVLYGWYTDKLKGDIGARDDQISETTQRLAQADEKIGLMAQTEEGLRADMAARKAELEQLTAEQQKAADAYAELQGRLDTANGQITSLNQDIDNLKQEMQAALAAAQEEHAAEKQQIEQTLGERIAFYRTALEGSDPERAAQMAQLESGMETARQELHAANAAREAMEAEKLQVEQNLATAQGEIQLKEQALQEMNGRLTGLQETLTQRENALAATQEELRVANETHAAQAADAAAALEQTQTAAAQAAAAAEAAMQQVQTEHTAQIGQAEERIGSLETELAKEQAALAALQTQYDGTVADLNGKLAATQQSLDETSARLQQTSAEAAATKEALEGQIAEKQAAIANLEQSIANERQQAADTLAATQQENSVRVTELRTLYTDLARLGGKQTEQGMLLSLANSELRFRISTAQLPEELPSLDKIAEVLNKHPTLKARIEGHTDSSGRDETNMELSKQRATAVMQALIDRGVDASRMSAEGLGETRPIAKDTTFAGRRANRRVEIYVTEN